MAWRVEHGHCIEVMAGMDAESVDACVCDPPYELTDGGQQNCASDVLRNSIINDAAYGDPLGSENSVSLRVFVDLLDMQAGNIDLDHEGSMGHVEVHHDASGRQIKDVLVDGGDAVVGEEGSGGEFRLWVREGGSRCIGACRCAAQGSATALRIPVGLRYDPLGEPEATAGVVALPRAEVAAVLTFDLRGGSAKLASAEGADKIKPRFLLLPAQTVGTHTTARRLAAVLQADDISEVDGITDGTLSFDLLAHKAFLSKMRPKVAQKGFMSKKWDGSGVAFDPRTWQQVFRVLKPGGHVLAFGGTRTYHKLVTAIEAAGFEIRDRILSLGGGDVEGESLGSELAWIYGSGFP